MTHTTACVQARGGPNCWPQIAPLEKVPRDDGTVGLEPSAAAEAVFACPHPTHYGYRFVWGRARTPEHRSRLTATPEVNRPCVMPIDLPPGR